MVQKYVYAVPTGKGGIVTRSSNRQYGAVALWYVREGEHVDQQHGIAAEGLGYASFAGNVQAATKARYYGRAPDAVVEIVAGMVQDKGSSKEDQAMKKQGNVQVQVQAQDQGKDEGSVQVQVAKGAVAGAAMTDTLYRTPNGKLAVVLGPSEKRTGYVTIRYWNGHGLGTTDVAPDYALLIVEVAKLDATEQALVPAVLTGKVPERAVPATRQPAQREPKAPRPRDPRLPAVGTHFGCKHQGKAIDVVEHEDGTFTATIDGALLAHPKGGQFTSVHAVKEAVWALLNPTVDAAKRPNGYRFLGLMPREERQPRQPIPASREGLVNKLAKVDGLMASLNTRLAAATQERQAILDRITALDAQDAPVAQPAEAQPDPVPEAQPAQPLPEATQTKGSKGKGRKQIVPAGYEHAVKEPTKGKGKAAAK